MKTLRFVSPAETEMAAAARYYEAQCRGLGRRFLDEVDRITRAIADHPEAGATVRGNIRRRPLRRFPFALLYIDSIDEILIMAVMDLHRDPEHWIRRL